MTSRATLYNPPLPLHPQGYFSLEDRKRGLLTLAKPLDYDAGPRTFQLVVVAEVKKRA